MSKPRKCRLDHHSPFGKIMSTAAENNICITNDLSRPDRCFLYYCNQKGKSVRTSVELKDAGKTVQYILDMRDGIVLITS